MNDTITAIEALDKAFGVLLYTRRITYVRVGDSLTYITSLKNADGTDISVTVSAGIAEDTDPVPFIAEELAKLAIDRDFCA